MTSRTKLASHEIPAGDQFEYVAEKLMLQYFRAIRRRMREKGISQTELAARLGVSQAYISKLLKYNQNLTIRSLAVLAEVMGVEWDQPLLIEKNSGIYHNDVATLTDGLSLYIPTTAIAHTSGKTDTHNFVRESNDNIESQSSDADDHLSTKP